MTGGTGKQAALEGYRVGGKTGTSEKLDEYDEDGNQVKDKIVSFIGVAPGPCQASVYLRPVPLSSHPFFHSPPQNKNQPAGERLSRGLWFILLFSRRMAPPKRP